MKKWTFVLVGMSFLLSCSTPEEKKGFTVSYHDLMGSEETGFEFAIEVPETGRYRVEVETSEAFDSNLWIEDYITNTDDRTYNVTGNLPIENQVGHVDGSPLAKGLHPMKIHGLTNAEQLKSITFTLLKSHEETPNFHTQNMVGDSWEIVWSDEFEYEGLPDSSLWAYNLGDWGWGNNELQYYTEADINNAEVKDGSLYITGREDANGDWTSARLTTAGRHSFTYGKIEFRAKVPTGRGTWAAGWTLGDAYKDEISWPYCGEIDILECVGFEINDTTGNGINHATCHTRAYYFKQGNQIGSQIDVDSMDTQFHLYAVEWDENEIRGYLDGEHYYTYDKNANEREWPFNEPQNIIVNLAIGGGWGGAKGMDPNLKNPRYILDYVRVYQKVQTPATE
ncbi:MAG: hypothetical protein SchgKO_09760 [Schleiferiaceae bacterium]